MPPRTISTALVSPTDPLVRPRARSVTAVPWRSNFQSDSGVGPVTTSYTGSVNGKVSVEATRVKGMNDHLELPVTHVFMMRDPEVMAQVIHYLDNGSFFRGVD